MKFVIGIILCIVGVALGLYLGLWLAFIGGIIQVIDQIKAEDLIATEIAIGVVKILFAGLIGWASALVFIAPGVVLIKE